MTLEEIVQRCLPPEPWAEGDKIPWDDPEFSRRMLREHLSQEHDLASRRFSVVDKQVEWIHHTLLADQPSRILDLGSGPGLYADRLALLGHHCTGIDFSPASIEFAREHAVGEPGKTTYLQADLRQADFGCSYDLAIFIFGEFNTFRPDDARAILHKTRAALRDGGILLLEAHTDQHVRACGEQPRTWRTSNGGVFSGGPHLVLTEHFWDEAARVATERTFVIDAVTAHAERYVQSVQSYTLNEYDALLDETGFRLRATLTSLPGLEPDGEFVVLLADAAATER